MQRKTAGFAGPNARHADSTLIAPQPKAVTNRPLWAHKMNETVNGPSFAWAKQAPKGIAT
ncbi:hypothetical protein [Loktanella sp. S4079]|uniref:hypothetical protein n=1 Tax=Loktanella sp. S4079 TaxID=579483 RepID=UPI0005FA5E27|nr:hypothetical protein [Loktanella sp. S4079]KJZ19911.1 hypothetical protein TW80_03300 [Loktanella sp. S4079]